MRKLLLKAKAINQSSNYVGLTNHLLFLKLGVSIGLNLKI